MCLEKHWQSVQAYFTCEWWMDMMQHDNQSNPSRHDAHKRWPLCFISDLISHTFHSVQDFFTHQKLWIELFHSLHPKNITTLDPDAVHKLCHRHHHHLTPKASNLAAWSVATKASNCDAVVTPVASALNVQGSVVELTLWHEMVSLRLTTWLSSGKDQIGLEPLTRLSSFMCWEWLLPLT